MSNEVELSRFIKQSLLDILDGIGEAKSLKMQNGDCTIAPGHILGKQVASLEQLITFEIETISDITKEGGIKISVISGEISSSNKISQKIKFSVPVCMQATK